MCTLVRINQASLFFGLDVETILEFSHGMLVVMMLVVERVHEEYKLRQSLWHLNSTVLLTATLEEDGFHGRKFSFLGQ